MGLLKGGVRGEQVLTVGLPAPHLQVVTPPVAGVHTLSIPHLQRFHCLEVNQQEVHVLQPEVKQAAEGIR